MTLHAVPNQHLHLFPIFYTLWSPPTIQNTLLKLPQLNHYWNDSILQVYPTSCKKLSASPTHFKYHETLLKLLQLNLYWEGPVMRVHSNTRRPLFRSYQSLSCGWIYSSEIISSCWKLHHLQLLHLKSQVKKKKKNQFSKLIPTLHSKTVCVNESRGGICREGKIPDLSQADTSYYWVHKI